jgi:hypothetical protein
MVAESFISERVQLARLCVSLNLTIPCSRIERSEPLAKVCKFLSRETRNFLLECFEFTHTTQNITSTFRSLTSPRAGRERGEFP